MVRVVKYIIVKRCESFVVRGVYTDHVLNTVCNDMFVLGFKNGRSAVE
jgi:hypothetical protein